MKKVKRQTETDNPGSLSLKNEVIGIVFLFVSIFFIFSVISYNPADASFFNSTPVKSFSNYGGRIGAEIAALLFNLFGYASYIILVYLLLITSFFLLNKRIKNMITKSCGYFLLLISFSAFVSNINPDAVIAGQNIKSGGIIGYFIDEFCQSQLTQVFSFFFFLLLIFISLILIAKLSLRKVVQFLFNLSIKAFKIIKQFVGTQVEKYKKYRRIKRIQNKYKKYSDLEKEAEVNEIKKIDKDRDLAVKEKKKIVKEPGKIPEESFLFSEG